MSIDNPFWLNNIKFTLIWKKFLISIHWEVSKLWANFFKKSTKPRSIYKSNHFFVSENEGRGITPYMSIILTGKFLTTKCSAVSLFMFIFAKLTFLLYFFLYPEISLGFRKNTPMFYSNIKQKPFILSITFIFVKIFHWESTIHCS